MIEKIKPIIKFIIDKSVFALLPVVERMLNLILKSINENTDSKFFYTYHQRPVKANDVNKASVWNFSRIDRSNVAILIQGPVIDKRKFTLESIRLYKKMNRGAVIIVSTWSDTPQEMIDELSKESILVLSDRPAITGSHNFNLQKKTTLRGIEVAKKYGCQYLLKTRTDQRFYEEDILELLINIHDGNPPKKNDILKGRIIELSLSVCKYRPWSLCDMFQFGYLEDIWTLWDIPDDNRHRTSNEYARSRYKVRDIVNENVAEIYLHTSLAIKLNAFNKYNYNAYFSFIGDYFYILDKEIIDLFWFKYSSEEYNLIGSRRYSKNHLLSMFKFSDYMILNTQGRVIKNNIDEYLDEYEN